MGSEAEVVKKFFDTLMQLAVVLRARYSCCLAHSAYAQATVVDMLMKGLLVVEQFENKTLPPFSFKKQLTELTRGIEARIADLTPPAYPTEADDEDLLQRSEDLLSAIGFTSDKTKFLS